MRMRNGSKWSALALLIVLAASTVSAQQAHHVDDKLLLNAGKTGDEWLMAAGNYSQTRYSPLKQIDASNVSRLGLAWYYDTASLPGVLEAISRNFERHSLRHADLGRGVRSGRPHRKRKVALGSQARSPELSVRLDGQARLRQSSHRPESLLRSGKSRRRGLWRQSLRRHARRAPRRSRRGNRQGGLGSRDRRQELRLQHHRRSAHREGQSHYRKWRRRIRRARLHLRVRRRRPAK